MVRVAENQDKSDAERNRYVYVQHTKMTSRKGDRVMCEELTDYRVVPSGSDSHFELVKLDGRLWNKGHYLLYDRLQPDDTDSETRRKESAKSADEQTGKEKKLNNKIDEDDETGESGVDRDIVEHMRKNLLYSKSRDGIEVRLFPLTSKAQAAYTFQLIGREHLNGREAYHIIFRPKDKGDPNWKGDAYIDESAYQPVLITTALSRRIPFAVRTLLGTDLPGLGFTVAYAPQNDGTWFPASFSTEFKIHVLYFFRREILLDSQNREFQKTHSEGKILDGFSPIEKP